MTTDQLPIIDGRQTAIGHSQDDHAGWFIFDAREAQDTPNCHCLHGCGKWTRCFDYARFPTEAAAIEFLRSLTPTA